MSEFKKRDERYYIPFKNAKLTIREANIVGFSLIFGFIGATGAALLLVEPNRMLLFGMLIVFLLVGNCIARKIWKSTYKDDRTPGGKKGD